MTLNPKDTLMPDTPLSDIEIIRQFSAEMRRIHAENRHVMSCAKKSLMANGMSAERASTVLHTALRVLTEELRQEA